MAETGESEFNSATQRAPIGKNIIRLSPAEWHQAPDVLREHGVCVFTNVATPEELAEREALFWSWVTQSTGGQVNRKPENMVNAKWKQFGFLESGVMTKFSIGQSNFLWQCRMLENVKRIYSCIWGTEDLVTGFDGCGVFRNPFLAPEGESWFTRLGWYHVDQDGRRVPDLDTFQGLLNFFPATANGCGSTVVVPRSHHRFTEMFADSQRQGLGGHSKLDKPGDFEKYCAEAVQVPLEAGDFLVWDSRTVHCNQGIDPTSSADVVLGPRKNQPLARLVAYICMLPRARVTSQEQVQLRQKFVREGLTGPHHPLRVDSQASRLHAAPNYKCPKPDDPRWKLV